MKIFIGNGENPPQNYDILIDPSGRHGVPHSHFDLSPVADISEAREIFAPNILNHLPLLRLKDTIKNYCERLRLGGELHLGGFHGGEIVRGFINEQVTTEQLNQFLYSQNACGIYTPLYIKAILEEFGLSNISFKNYGVKFIISGTRSE